MRLLRWSPPSPRPLQGSGDFSSTGTDDWKSIFLRNNDWATGPSVLFKMKPKFDPPDSIKNAENKRKHGIRLYEARKAFDHPNGFSRRDKRNSESELRFFRYGKINNKYCVVRYVIRAVKIRIFGAAYWRKARSIYENFREEKGTH